MRLAINRQVDESRQRIRVIPVLLPRAKRDSLPASLVKPRTGLGTIHFPALDALPTRMNNRFRSAEKCATFKGKGYFLTLSRILSESGLIPEKRVRNAIARVREALKELRAEGFLDRMKAYDEEISYEGIGQRYRM